MKCVVKLKNCWIGTKIGVVVDIDPGIMIVVKKRQKDKKAKIQKYKRTKRQKKERKKDKKDKKYNIYIYIRPLQELEQEGQF